MVEVDKDKKLMLDVDVDVEEAKGRRICRRPLITPVVPTLGQWQGRGWGNIHYQIIRLSDDKDQDGAAFIIISDYQIVSGKAEDGEAFIIRLSGTRTGMGQHSLSD